MSVPKRTDRTWRKSSYSGSENCVEVSREPSTVGVRDTKAPIDELDFRAAAWKALLDHLR